MPACKLQKTAHPVSCVKRFDWEHYLVKSFELSVWIISMFKIGMCGAFLLYTLYHILCTVIWVRKKNELLTVEKVKKFVGHYKLSEVWLMNIKTVYIVFHRETLFEVL